MQRYQRKNQRLEILDEVVEDAETFWICGFCDIDERTNLCGLDRKSVSIFLRNVSVWRTSKEICSLPIRISNSCRPSLFFWGHLLSSSLHNCKLKSWRTLRRKIILHDFAGLDDALDLIYHERANTHCKPQLVQFQRREGVHALSFRIRESFR